MFLRIRYVETDCKHPSIVVTIEQKHVCVSNLVKTYELLPLGWTQRYMKRYQAGSQAEIALANNFELIDVIKRRFSLVLF